MDKLIDRSLSNAKIRLDMAIDVFSGETKGSMVDAINDVRLAREWLGELKEIIKESRLASNKDGEN